MSDYSKWAWGPKWAWGSNPLITPEDPYAFDHGLTWKIKQDFGVMSHLAQAKIASTGMPVTYTAPAVDVPPVAAAKPVELDGRCAAWADAARKSIGA